MTFWIYENWRARGHRAVLHRGSWAFCNDGRGRAGGSSPHNAAWHGPYVTLEEAKAMMLRLSKAASLTEDRCI